VTDLSTNSLADYRLRTVGHIFQSLNLIPFLSVAENIAFPLITLGVPSQERNARVDGLLAAMDLVARRRHRPHELSGGEQQRVAIAAALANDPPLLLADEPTGELDTETSRQIVEYLLRVNKENKKTILLVTHDPVVARVGDQILRIQDGQIAGIYQPESVVGHEQQEVLVQYLRQRIAHIEDGLARLDRAMKKRTIDGESYAASRRRLRTAQHVLRDELHRIGES
jgi:putative ABC transport system ATP-binding protein